MWVCDWIHRRGEGNVNVYRRVKKSGMNANSRNRKWNAITISDYITLTIRERNEISENMNIQQVVKKFEMETYKPWNTVSFISLFK